MPRLNGPKIVALMEKKGWTQAHLMDVSGIGSRHTTGMVLGSMNVSLETCRQIAAAFGLACGDILLEWRVREYGILLRVWPLSVPQSKDAIVGYVKKRTMSVVTENVAQIKKWVSFAAESRTDSFPLQYRTRSGGLLSLRDDANVRDPKKNVFLQTGEGWDIGIFYDHGNSVMFEFEPNIPEPPPSRKRPAASPVSDKYVLDVECLNGYGQGQRNLTAYLPNLTFYENIKVTLDVNGYRNDDKYQWKDKPLLRFFENNETHVGEYRRPENRADKPDPIRPHDPKSDGTWEWSLSDCRPGALYLSWDFHPLS